MGKLINVSSQLRIKVITLHKGILEITSTEVPIGFITIGFHTSLPQQYWLVENYVMLVWKSQR